MKYNSRYALRKLSEDLESVGFPDGLLSIGQSAFNRCTGLKTVSIPVSVIHIEYAAFHRCTALTTICYGGTDEDRARLFINNTEESNQYLLNATWIYNSDPYHWISLPSNLKTLDREAFRKTGIEAVKIPDGCEKIGEYAFAECEGLKRISIPSSVKEISDSFLAGSTNAVIVCPADSSAEAWAKDHDWPYILE